MRLLGISGKESTDKVKKDNSYFMIHPLDPSVKIYWLTDVPHLLKCTRSNILQHAEVQCAAGTARFEYYRSLYELERKNDFRRAHKLTESHLFPSPFEKMNVRKAANYCLTHLCRLSGNTEVIYVRPSFSRI
ncbi:Cell division ftsJ-like protein [Daphnia magna]|uniref:Cell division ftsJ-like protein n=1 Tax=Daphnia magna TaxID=35525 RepID=A0A164R271_9CRUS|nr:Cell division ftsJ-like protein [Daphnia magna]